MCQHSQVAAINAAIAAGRSTRDIARQFGVTKDAVFRHAQHVPTTAVQHQRVRDEVAQLDLLARIRHQDELHNEVMNAARASGEVRDLVAAAGMYVQTTRVIAQFKIAAAQHNNRAAVMRTIVQTLRERYPEALWALSEALDELEVATA